MLSALATLALASPDAVALEQASRRVEVRASSVLGVWAVANLATGSVGAFTAERPEVRGFHGMNAAWNTVNGALAIGGLVGGRNRDTSSLDVVQARRRNLQRALRVNLVLDAVYVGAGVTTLVVATDRDEPLYAGAGASLVLQGAFLAAFDASFLHAHVRAGAPPVQLALTPHGPTLHGRW